MQKPLTPRQQVDYGKLDLASKRAEIAMGEIELASGKNSPQYAVAERQRDEILAKMQRMTGAQDVAETVRKPAASGPVTVVIKSRRIIRQR